LDLELGLVGRWVCVDCDLYSLTYLVYSKNLFILVIEIFLQVFLG
jgi:hypothetical protein